MTEGEPRLRALYVSYLGLSDPLVQTQVVAYLVGLAERRHAVHLLTFEPERLTRARRRELRERFAARGIVWHGLRYHKRPSLPATLVDVAWGAIMTAYLVRRHRLDAVHARQHVAGGMALIARRIARFELIFDIRGLMAEEYEDTGRWRRGSIPWRLAKLVERRAIERAAAVVVLTERVRDHLFPNGDARVLVIPCCADVERIEAARGDRDVVRERLGVSGRPVLIYVGKFTGWYMEREMVEFYATARGRLAGLHFLILTQGEPDPIVDQLNRAGIGEGDYTITSVAPEEVGSYLAAADVAISFIRPYFSKLSSSPTKIGEYLAAGLPVVCGAGIGDVDALLEEYGVGVVLSDFGPGSMAVAAESLTRALGDVAHAGRSVRAARERLSVRTRGIPAYDAAYSTVARGREQFLRQNSHLRGRRRASPQSRAARGLGWGR